MKSFTLMQSPNLPGIFCKKSFVNMSKGLEEVVRNLKLFSKVSIFGHKIANLATETFEFMKNFTLMQSPNLPHTLCKKPFVNISNGLGGVLWNLKLFSKVSIFGHKIAILDT